MFTSLLHHLFWELRRPTALILKVKCSWRPWFLKKKFKFWLVSSHLKWTWDPVKVVAFLDLVYIRLSLCMVEFQLAIVGTATNCVQILKLSLSLCRDVTTELCLFLKQWCLRTQGSQPSNSFQPWDFFRFSWVFQRYNVHWIMKNMCNFTLWNISIKLLHYFPAQSLSYKWTPLQLYFRKTLSGLAL